MAERAGRKKYEIKGWEPEEYNRGHESVATDVNYRQTERLPAFPPATSVNITKGNSSSKVAGTGGSGKGNFGVYTPNANGNGKRDKFGVTSTNTVALQSHYDNTDAAVAHSLMGLPQPQPVPSRQNRRKSSDFDAVDKERGYKEHEKPVGGEVSKSNKMFWQDDEVENRKKRRRVIGAIVAIVLLVVVIAAIAASAGGNSGGKGANEGDNNGGNGNGNGNGNGGGTVGTSSPTASPLDLNALLNQACAKNTGGNKDHFCVNANQVGKCDGTDFDSGKGFDNCNGGTVCRCRQPLFTLFNENPQGECVVLGSANDNVNC